MDPGFRRDDNLCEAILLLCVLCASVVNRFFCVFPRELLLASLSSRSVPEASRVGRRCDSDYTAGRSARKLSRRCSAQRSASAQIVGVGFTTPPVTSTLPSTM
jgi:hypothetical protein